MALSNLAAVVLQQDRPRDARELVEESGKLFDDLRKPLGTNAHFQKHYEAHTKIRDAIRRSLETKSP